MTCWRAQRQFAQSNRSRSGRACHRDLKRGRSRAGRAAAHELGATAQTGLRYRRGTLPQLRRRLEDHCCHRRSAGDSQNPQPFGPVHPRTAACAGSSSRSIRDNLRTRKPLANASRRRRSLGVRASGAIRNLSRAPDRSPAKPDQYKSGFLINHKRELTSLPVLRYSSGHRKGRLKILYRTLFHNGHERTHDDHCPCTGIGVATYPAWQCYVAWVAMVLLLIALALAEPEDTTMSDPPQLTLTECMQCIRASPHHSGSVMESSGDEVTSNKHNPQGRVALFTVKASQRDLSLSVPSHLVCYMKAEERVIVRYAYTRYCSCHLLVLVHLSYRAAIMSLVHPCH
jgi:hypothetical protein